MGWRLNERKRLEPSAEPTHVARPLLKVLWAVSALASSASPVHAQRLPVEPGNRVRVGVPDSAALGRWLEGNVVAATRMVSLSSILGALGLTAGAVFLERSLFFSVFTACASLMVIFLHRKNIARILKGEEPKI